MSLSALYYETSTPVQCISKENMLAYHQVRDGRVVQAAHFACTSRYVKYEGLASEGQGECLKGVPRLLCGPYSKLGDQASNKKLFLSLQAAYQKQEQAKCLRDIV